MKHPFPTEAVPLLLDWYRTNARPLPWRENRDAYRVLVSEVMLQQTRAEAVRPYFARFLAALPTVSALAEADGDTLLKLGRGWAITAGCVTCNGRHSVWWRISAASFRRMSPPCAVCPVSGGTRQGRWRPSRMTSPPRRWTATSCACLPARPMMTRTSCSRRQNRRRGGAGTLHPRRARAILRRASIELGALVCLPGEPRCDVCPLALLCRARAAGHTRDLPIRGAAKARRVERRVVLILRLGGQEAAPVVIRRRPAGLLGGLYEFPNLLCGQLPAAEGDDPAARTAAFLRGLGIEPLAVRPVGTARHLFTHVEWQMEGVCATLPAGAVLPEDWLAVSPADLQDSFALPSAFAAFRPAAACPVSSIKKRLAGGKCNEWAVILSFIQDGAAFIQDERGTVLISFEFCISRLLQNAGKRIIIMQIQDVPEQAPV